jgi:hypothetical protein
MGCLPRGECGYDTDYLHLRRCAVSAIGWSEPKRVRRSAHRGSRHLGYVTLVAYPNRDITVHSEGSPICEVVIADERELHVALLQRFKAHWLVQCGKAYGTTERVWDMTEDRAIALALSALERSERGEALVDLLCQAMDAV